MFKRFKRLYCGVVGHKEFLFPVTSPEESKSTMVVGAGIIMFNQAPYKATMKFCARCDMLYWETKRGNQDLADIAEFPGYHNLFKQYEEDKEMRKKYPSLQKQWDSYQVHKRLLKP